jgi:hypothetical protein
MKIPSIAAWQLKVKGSTLDNHSFRCSGLIVPYIRIVKHNEVNIYHVQHGVLAVIRL